MKNSPIHSSLHGVVLLMLAVINPNKELAIGIGYWSRDTFSYKAWGIRLHDTNSHHIMNFRVINTCHDVTETHNKLGGWGATDTVSLSRNLLLQVHCYGTTTHGTQAFTWCNVDCLTLSYSVWKHTFWSHQRKKPQSNQYYT